MRHFPASSGCLVGLLTAVGLVGSACGRAKPKPPLPGPVTASHVPCDTGETRDPPHHEVRPAIQALRSRDYEAAQQLVEALLAKYPESASLRVWRGDALLGQDSTTSVPAALEAYLQARALDGRGCKLRERERYFLAVGLADAELRQKRAEPALAELAAAEREWPGSAEVAYHRARAECLLGKSDDCFEHLKTAFDQARSRQRVRFARSHHSLDDLLQRAEGQAEFDGLRKEPRYRALVARAAASDGGTGPP